MSDDTQITDEAKLAAADPNAPGVAAMARFDAVVGPVLAQITPGSVVNGALLASVVGSIRGGLAAMTSPPDETQPAEQSRDETHQSIDPQTGTLTADAAQATGQMQAAGIDPSAPDAAAQLQAKIAADQAAVDDDQARLVADEATLAADEALQGS